MNILKTISLKSKTNYNIMDNITKIQNFWFNAFIIITYISYFALAIGLLKTQPKYLSTLSFFVKLYVCFFLIIRFNPFRKVQFSELDRKIVFSAALFLITENINDYFMKYFQDYKKIKTYFSGF
jgi:hypothetical protein